MEKENKKIGVTAIAVAFITGISAIACCLILTNGITSYKESVRGGGLSATGSASMDFESDLIVWEGSFHSHEDTTTEAYKTLQSDAQKVRKYLLDNGITEEEMVFSSVETNMVSKPIYDDYGNMVDEIDDGVEMYQSLRVTSADIDKVEMISRDITTLLESGVQFSSFSPQYYCSALDDVKLQLIEEAAKNAKQRIDIMAQESGCSAGDLLTANLGVFQITAKNSGTSDYSYDGAFDTSSREKTASITVRLNYAVE